MLRYPMQIPMCFDLKPCKSKVIKGGLLCAACNCDRHDGLQDPCIMTKCGKCCIVPRCPSPMSCSCVSKLPYCCVKSMKKICKNLSNDTKKSNLKNNCENNMNAFQSSKIRENNNSFQKPLQKTSCSCNKFDCESKIESNAKSSRTYNEKNTQPIQLPLEPITNFPGCIYVS